MIADLPWVKEETPAQLDTKIRENFISKLNLDRAEVNKFVFTARHRLQIPKNGKPPKTIVVLLDLDHVPEN